MKRFIFVFLALLLALCPSVSAAAASDPLFSQTASGNQNQPADASTQTEAPEAQAPEESETQAETELQPVLLDTDQVSTEDILMYASACIVMDTNTGAILYYKNMLDRKYPASTTKIMTTLLALDRTSMTDTITFSENAINSITSVSYTHLFCGKQKHPGKLAQIYTCNFFLIHHIGIYGNHHILHL